MSPRNTEQWTVVGDWIWSLPKDGPIAPEDQAILDDLGEDYVARLKYMTVGNQWSARLKSVADMWKGIFDEVSKWSD